MSTWVLLFDLACKFLIAQIIFLLQLNFFKKNLFHVNFPEFFFGASDLMKSALTWAPVGRRKKTLIAQESISTKPTLTPLFWGDKGWPAVSDRETKGLFLPDLLTPLLPDIVGPDVFPPDLLLLLMMMLPFATEDAPLALF